MLRLSLVVAVAAALFGSGVALGLWLGGSPPAPAPIAGAALAAPAARVVEDARLVAFRRALAVGDSEAALSSYEALVDDAGADALTARVRGELLEPLRTAALDAPLLGDRIAFVEALLWLYPRDVQALEALARAHERRGDLDAALTRWWQLADASLDLEADRARRRARLLVEALVDGARTRGDGGRVRSLFDDALARDDDVALRVRYAEVLHDDGDAEAALVVLEEVPRDLLSEGRLARLHARIADSAALARAYPDGLPLTRDGNHFLVEVATAGGETLRLLLDTGATVSVLRPALLARLAGARPTQERVRLGTAGGVVTATLHRVEGLRLGTVELEPTQIAGLALDGLTGIDGLLGSDVLSRFDYRLDPVAARLHLGRRLR